MVTLQQFDDDALRELSQRTDSVGILSVYVDAEPGERPNLEGTAIDLKNRFRELQRRVSEEDPSQNRDVSASLDRLWPEVEKLASPTEPGRGRVLFGALGGDWVLRLESHMAGLKNRLVFDESPFLHPLLELLDEGRSAGVVLVSSEEARVYEWRLGVLRSLSQMKDEYVEAPHERSGQIGGGPSGRFDTPMREQRQSRDRDLAQRFLADVVSNVSNLATERGWERILVSGGERWTESTISRFPETLQGRLIAEPRVLLGLDETGLADAVSARLHDEHTEREKRLLDRVLEAGQSGAGALGLSEVAAALNAGRAAHLVYDPDVRYAGSVGEDGTLYAGEENVPGGEGKRPEPRLTERLVEQAFRTGVRISPVEGAATGALKEADGIGALLRW